jgi:hypothetical protein
MSKTIHAPAVIFNSDDYLGWKMSIHNQLLARNYWGIITKTKERPEPPSASEKDTSLAVEARRRLNDYLKRSNMALGLINLLLDRPLQYITEKAKTPIEAYRLICARYEDDNAGRDMQLLETLLTTKMDESQSLHVYLDRVNKLIELLTDANHKFKPEWIIHLTIRGLPSAYAPVLPVIAVTKDITVDQVRTMLLMHESNLKSGKQDGARDQLLYTSSQSPTRDQRIAPHRPLTPQRRGDNERSDRRPADRHRDDRRRDGRRDDRRDDRRRDDRKPNRSAKSNSSESHCSHCNRPGHTVDQCWSRQRDSRERANAAQEAAERPS